jgi:hypothetical protein
MPICRHFVNRGDWIRTSDRPAPSRVRYQTAPLPARGHPILPASPRPKCPDACSIVRLCLDGQTNPNRRPTQQMPATARIVRSGCEHMFVPNTHQTQRCSRCGGLKPVSDFAWHRRARGQLDTYCRPCRAAYKRQHYVANRQRYVAAATRRKRALIAERTAFLVEYFRTHPCADCRESDPIVLEFDHVAGKEFTIAAGIRRRSWQAILDEIAKRDVVCANCHRRRTALRAGFARVALAQRHSLAPTTHR